MQSDPDYPQQQTCRKNQNDSGRGGPWPVKLRFLLIKRKRISCNLQEILFLSAGKGFRLRYGSLFQQKLVKGDYRNYSEGCDYTIISRICFTFLLSRSNWSGVSACAPSHRAQEGLLCTSIIMASAPQAAAARAIGFTSLDFPVA